MRAGVAEPQAGPARLTALRLVPALVLGGLLLLLSVWYLSTMPPTLNSLQVSGWNDATEFQVVGSYWGVAHSPGYPLYTLGANLWVRMVGLLVPDSEPAWRVSLFSLATALVTLLLFYSMLRRLQVGWPLAAATTFFLGGTELFWRHAILAEVYMLNLMLLVLALWIGLRWADAPDRWPWLVALGMTYGAMAAHHRTALLLIPFQILWMMGSQWDGVRPWIGRLLLIGVAGAPLLLLYAYLPLAVLADRGREMARFYADASRRDIFLGMVQSREWWGLVQFPESLPALREESLALFRQQAGQVRGTLWILLGAIGLVAGGARAFPLAGLGAALLWFGLSYNVDDVDTMLIPLTALLLAGIPLLAGWLSRRPAARSVRARLWLQPLVAVLLLGAALVGAPPLAAEVDQSHDTVAGDFSQILRLMAEDGPSMSVLAYEHAPLAVVQYTRARYQLEGLEPLYPNHLDALAPGEIRRQFERRWAEGREIYYSREVTDLAMVGELDRALAEGRYRSAPTYFPDLFQLYPTGALPPVTVTPEVPLSAAVGPLRLTGYDARWIERRSGLYLEVVLFWAADAAPDAEATVTLWPAGGLEGHLESYQGRGFRLGAIRAASLRTGDRLRDPYQLRLNSLPDAAEGYDVGLTIEIDGGAATTVLLTVPTLVR